MNIVRVTFIVFILLMPLVVAGQWHVGNNSHCGDCHLQHSSVNDIPIPGGPFVFLLKKNTVNELCLTCHDGSDATAPDVLSPVSMYASTSARESAAGQFDQLMTTNPDGHSLWIQTTTPLQVASTSGTLTCASCHAVHGNDNYRNLLTDPADRGENHQIILGVDVFTDLSPEDPPSISGSVAAFQRGNIAYAAKISEWCSSCHDLLAENNPSTLPAHFNGHPSDIALNAYISDRHTDPLHWNAGAGEGFPGAAGIPRVPFLSPDATSFANASTPHESSAVSCLSCHKAHGSTNKKAMLWPYLEGGDNYIAGCQQCHNK